jgi:hypothetical protein
LVALPGDDLEILKDSITKNFPIQCHSFGIDLSERGAFCQIYGWVKENNCSLMCLQQPCLPVTSLKN